MFSSPAKSCSTIKQEALAIFYFCKKMEFYIRDKASLLEIDRGGLLWMENSTNNMMKRMTSWFIQHLVTIIRHISGPRNHFADFISRAHPLSTQEATINHLLHNLHMTSIANASSRRVYLQPYWRGAILAPYCQSRQQRRSVSQLYSATHSQAKSVSFEPATSKVATQGIRYKSLSTSLPKGGKAVVNSD